MVKYLLIDGNNLLCRAHFAARLTDGKGRPIAGTFGVMRMTRSLIKQFNPKVVVIAWDGGKSKERLAVYPDYKANRLSRDPAMREHIVRQVSICQSLFDTLPVRQLKIDGVEADDIIGLLCEKLKGEKVILSNDTDFVQLVDKDVSLYLPNKKKQKADKKEGFHLTAKNVEEFLGFPVKHYVLWKSIVGDPSDNIKGINGLGPKKATGIIKNGLSGKKKLPINAQEMAVLDRNKYLIKLAALLQPADIKKIKSAFNAEKSKTIRLGVVREKFIKLGFKRLVVGFDNWIRAFEGLK